MYGYVISYIIFIIVSMMFFSMMNMKFCHPVSSGYTGFYCAECWDTETLRSIAKIDVFSRLEL